MATAQATPAATVPPPRPQAVAAAKPDVNSSQALVATSQPQQVEEQERFTGPVARLPVELDVVVPVTEFRVRNLLTLEPGNVIQSQWSYGEDVPLASGNVQLAWTEFEVIDTHLAVRITRLP